MVMKVLDKNMFVSPYSSSSGSMQAHCVNVCNSL